MHKKILYPVIMLEQCSLDRKEEGPVIFAIKNDALLEDLKTQDYHLYETQHF